MRNRGFAWIALVAIAAAQAGVIARAQATSSGPAAIFRFCGDDFWLNLHHFLYVLGRAEAKAPDMSRRAVRGAPGEQEGRLASLTPDEQQVWRASVSSYAAGLSKLDAVRDDPLVAVGNQMVAARSAPTLDGRDLDPNVKRDLERARP